VRHNYDIMILYMEKYKEEKKKDKDRKREWVKT